MNYSNVDFLYRRTKRKLNRASLILHNSIIYNYQDLLLSFTNNSINDPNSSLYWIQSFNRLVTGSSLFFLIFYILLQSKKIDIYKKNTILRFQWFFNMMSRSLLRITILKSYENCFYNIFTYNIIKKSLKLENNTFFFINNYLKKLI